MTKSQAVLFGILSAKSISNPASRRYYSNVQWLELASTWQIISDPFQDPFRVQNHAIQGRCAIKNPTKTLVFDRVGHVDIVEVVGSSPISSTERLRAAMHGAVFVVEFWGE